LEWFRIAKMLKSNKTVNKEMILRVLIQLDKKKNQDLDIFLLGSELCGSAYLYM
jgi:hypothetical protein